MKSARATLYVGILIRVGLLLVIAIGFLIGPVKVYPQTSSQSSNVSTQQSSLPPMNLDDPFARPGDQTEVKIPDPIEPVNRFFYRFNNQAYYYAMKPAATGWYYVMPGAVRGSIKNFFENLDMPNTLVNSLLQAEPRKAGITTSRFLINSTVGIGGFFDPAGYWLNSRNEDFDDTFRTWGIGTGPFVMLPLMGPSTARGSVALVLDNALYPPNYFDGEDATVALLGVSGVRNVNTFSFSLGQYEALQEGAIDPYSALKDVYEQRMQQGKDLID
jgi:phospholipid-binding lipoprotein MlaA